MARTLEARSLRKQYRNKLAVENVSLSVSGGEIIGLLGPNGAGKTTCFYMIVGLLRVDGGDIFSRENVEVLSQLQLESLKANIVEGKIRWEMFPPQFSKDCKTFIEQLLQLNPRDRLSGDEALNHSFSFLCQAPELNYIIPREALCLIS